MNKKVKKSHFRMLLSACPPHKVCFGKRGIQNQGTLDLDARQKSAGMTIKKINLPPME
jgi:hypothetical protein